MNDDDIQVVLTLEDQEFTLGIKNAKRLINEFRGTVNSAASTNKKLDTSFEHLVSRTRDFTVILAGAQAALRTIWETTAGWQMQIMRAAGDIEKFQVMMKGMSQETSDTARELEALANTKFITDFAQNAPFKMDALIDTFVKFKTVGIDPTNGSMKSLTDSVAAFGGNSDILHRASIAIQQMVGKGVISMEELRQQLGEAVPRAMEIMARSMDLSMGELVGKIQTGTVESRSAIGKMLAEMTLVFGGAGDRMMTTWDGVLQSLEVKWKLFLKEIAGDGDDPSSYFSTIKEMARDLSDWLASPEGLQFAKDMSAAMAEMAIKAQELFTWIYQNRDAIIQLGKAMLTYFVASRITMGIANIIGALRNMSTSTGMVATGLRDFSAQMDKVRAANVAMQGALATSNSAMANMSTRATTLIGNVGRVGLAFAGLAGPIGIAVSVIGTAVGAFLSMRRESDELAASIIRTRGVAATDKSLEQLADEREALETTLNNQKESLENAESGWRQNLLNLVPGYDQKSSVANIKKNLEGTQNEIQKNIEATRLATEAMTQRQIDLAVNATQRIVSDGMSPLQAAFDQQSVELSKQLNDAKGEKSAVKRIHDERLAAAGELRDGQISILDQQIVAEHARLAKLEELNGAITDQEQKASDAVVAYLNDRKTQVAQAFENFRQTYDAANEYVVKPTKPKKLPKSQDPAEIAKRQSLAAINSAEGLYDALMVQSAKAQGKLAETNPILEQTNEKLRQLWSEVRPQDMPAFEAFSEKAREAAETLYQLQQQKKAADESDRAYMKMLGDTASALDDTEEGRLMRAKVQTLEIAEQVKEYDKLIERMREFNVDPAEIEKLEAAKTAYESSAMAKVARDSESSWQSMMRSMREFKTDWAGMWQDSANLAIDEMVRFAKEGKLSMTGLIDHVLEQLLRVQLQKSLVTPLSNVLDAGVSAALGSFGSNAFTGTTNYTGGFGSQVATGSSGYSSGFGSQLRLTTSAMGNIMTEWGPAKLNKYAKGGIAKTPQISVFGEGSTPEAYVPLPDGRSIPVTMAGGGQGMPNVQVNVINESGQAVSAEQQGGGRFDGESFVLDVVLKAANRPGDFRDGMKGALR